jgi:hypothetical protein
MRGKPPNTIPLVQVFQQNHHTKFTTQDGKTEQIRNNGSISFFSQKAMPPLDNLVSSTYFLVFFLASAAI